MVFNEVNADHKNRRHGLPNHIIQKSRLIDKQLMIRNSHKTVLHWAYASSFLTHRTRHSLVGLYGIVFDSKKDLQEARYWLRKSASQGNENAQKWLNDFG